MFARSFSSLMRSEFNSIISQRPSMMSEMQTPSHLTILRPRDNAPSDVVSIFSNFVVAQDKETWRQRTKLIFRILIFCLGPGNIWRFPEQAFHSGHSIYIYVYIIYSWIFGVPLLIFEINLSQYFFKGFGKLFAISQYMGGITLSMTIYCIFANMVYSIIGTYSIMFLSSAFNPFMSHSYCSESMNIYSCQENSNLSVSPEYVYFFNYVERAVDINGDIFNWRNALILACIWIILCIVFVLKIIKYHWICIVMTLIIFFSLCFVTVVSLTLDGAINGLSKMIVPKNTNIIIDHLIFIVYPAEQLFVSLGLGSGPLTTVWTNAKIKYWSVYDCIFVNIIAVVCSLLSAMIFFCAVGNVATKNNKTVDDYIKFQSDDINTFIIVTQMFNNLQKGLNNFTLCLYYLILFISCFYTMLEYTQIIFIYIGSYVPIKKSIQKKIIICGCCLFFLVTANFGVNKVGFHFLMAINKNFSGTALTIILCFELIAMSYIYGVTNFCDDIDFMLGYEPNHFLQTMWLFFPFLLFVLSIFSIYLKYKRIESTYDSIALCLAVILTIGPVLVFACYRGYKTLKSLDSSSRNPSSRAND